MPPNQTPREFCLQPHETGGHHYNNRPTPNTDGSSNPNNLKNDNPHPHHNAPPTPAKNNNSRPAAKATNSPTTYAGPAGRGAETPFHKVTNAHSMKLAPLFNNTLTPVQREIIITISESVLQGIIDDRILRAVN